MPEGDTLERTARALWRWIGGRQLTEARARDLDVRKLVGRTVEDISAQGKHLLIRLSGGSTIHTHLRMSGSWHVYSAGERWRRSPATARLVLQAADHIAVCFHAPVVEVVPTAQLGLHPALAGLGPDILDPDLAVEEVIGRARHTPASTPIGDVLLDQRVVAGIGNMWRAEALYRCGVAPRTAIADLDDAVLDTLVTTAAALMASSVADRRPPMFVYGRAGLPCAGCGTRIRSERFGRDNRTAYWCPTCQATPTKRSRAAPTP